MYKIQLEFIQILGQDLEAWNSVEGWKQMSQPKFKYQNVDAESIDQVLALRHTQNEYLW